MDSVQLLSLLLKVGFLKWLGKLLNFILEACFLFNRSTDSHNQLIINGFS